MKINMKIHFNNGFPYYIESFWPNDITKVSAPNFIFLQLMAYKLLFAGNFKNFLCKKIFFKMMIVLDLRKFS